MAEPRTHYQISVTAGQAVGLFVGLLGALGAAFFFGLMMGLSGRPTGRAEEPAPPAVAEPESAAAGEPAPRTIPPATAAAASGPSRTELAGVPSMQAPGLEPTVPSTVRSFEDGTDEPFPAPVAGRQAESAPSAPARAPAAAPKPSGGGPKGPAAAAPSAAGKVWVQAASLSSREEANALTARLSRHGFHTVLLTASGSKGTVYRVRVGPYRTEEEAAKASARLSKQEKIREPWVVPEGK